MKLAIMQPYIFPYIGYFQLISAVDKFVILDDVNFIMRGWINRNRILVNGKDHLFTIPLKKASQNKLIFECELVEGNWNAKFLKTIEICYNKAPFYSDCFGVISSILSTSENNLSKLLSFQLKEICNYLNIKTEIVDSSRLYSNRHLKAQEKIIDICNKESADNYYNAIGGKELYDLEEFKKNNIKLRFLRTRPQKYFQFNNDFLPFLSIIDIMMFNDKDTISGFLNEYELI
jgi:hypothetical protein